MLDLRFENIADPLIRDAIFNIVEEFRKQDTFNSQLKHFEINFLTPVTNFKFPHKLGFVPKDVILTSSIGYGVATFNYDLFDNVNFDITTTDAVKIRFFAGSFLRGSQA